MDGYLKARGEPYKSHAFRTLFHEAEREIQQLDPVKAVPSLAVEMSRGKGNWAAIPWIALLDSRETSTTQEGVYVVYLFRQDMKGVYLTLNQGVTRVKKEQGGGQAALAYLSGRARDLRKHCERLPREGFELGAPIDLAVERGLGREYEAGTVAHKFYASGKLPDEEFLRRDLAAVIDAYQEYIAARPIMVPAPSTPTKGSPSAYLIELAKARRLEIPPAIAIALRAGLACQPFVLLAGPAGTGKTQVASAVFGLPGHAGQTVEVEGGWTDSASAFGYISPTTQDFIPGPILLRLLELLQSSATTPVLLLDEINVSPPHVYLAPLLSVLERAFAENKTVPLLIAQSGLSEETRDALEEAAEAHSGLRIATVGPFTQLLIDIPPNLRIIGTLNFDSSTEDLAPKLLSRSFVVWFENPSVSGTLALAPRSSYDLGPTAEPNKRLGEVLTDLMNRGLGASARIVHRVQLALQDSPSGGKDLVDIALAGLVLPQLQTVSVDSGNFPLDDAFISALPPGLFRNRLDKMRGQLANTGMANLWLT